MEDKILQLIVEDREIAWKAIIYDLVRQEGMDPWDIDVSILAQKYVQKLHEIKEMNLKISGKVLLAAAILLRIKSKKLLGDDLDEFDRLLAGSEMTEEAFYDELEKEAAGQPWADEKFELFPRVPQARKRKVSVFDLVKALEQALEVKKRRLFRIPIPEVKIPKKKFDITAALTGLFVKLRNIFGSSGRTTFTQLLPGQKKEDKVFTFIPLLHLSSQQKVELQQEQHFGEIHILPGEKINEPLEELKE